MSTGKCPLTGVCNKPCERESRCRKAADEYGCMVYTHAVVHVLNCTKKRGLQCTCGADDEA